MRHVHGSNYENALDLLVVCTNNDVKRINESAESALKPIYFNYYPRRNHDHAKRLRSRNIGLRGALHRDSRIRPESPPAC
tara:strand:+ start:1935 stop:2174 length:240 start_codon:yes stop_codon:yes gene_type:complete